jgi:hypothetical protein
MSRRAVRLHVGAQGLVDKGRERHCALLSQGPGLDEECIVYQNRGTLHAFLARLYHSYMIAYQPQAG